MAIIIVNELPPDLTADEYLKVAEIVQADGNPDGMLFHTGFTMGDHIQVIDAWESRDKFDAFRESRLMPAIMQVVGHRMAEADGPPPEPTDYAPLDLNIA